MEEPSIYRRPKVYVTRRIPQKGVDVLLKDCNVSQWDSEDSVARGELLLNVAGVDAILCMANDVIDSEVLDAAGPNLKVVATMCSSLDDVDVKTCDKRRIRVLPCPTLGSESRADLTLALMLLTLKRAASEQRRSVVQDTKETNTAYWKTCINMTFGIYGLDALGSTIARRLLSVGINSIIAYDPNSNKVVNDCDSTVKVVGWKEFLSQSDVFCFCDNGQDTQSSTQFDKAAFDMMKPNAVVIIGENGHGSTYDSVNFIHLYEALRDGKFLAVGINTCNQGPVPYQYPLSGLHNCVFLPQTQESSFDVRHKISVAVAERLVKELCNTVTSPTATS